MTKKITFWALLTIFAVACGPTIPLASVSATPSATSLLSRSNITTENASNLFERMHLSQSGAGIVAAIKFSADSMMLTVAYVGEDKVRKWNLANGAMMASLPIHPLELGAIAFDATGKLIVTGAGINWQEHKTNDEYLGVSIWDLQSGNIVRRFLEKYDHKSGLLTRNLIPTLIISPDSRWILMIRASADPDLVGLKKFDMEGLTIHQIGDGYVDFSREPEQDDFDILAMDQQGKFFAAADEFGKVSVFAFTPPNYPVEELVRVEQSEANRIQPLALDFDPRRHWLARVRGTSLTIWNLQSPSYEHQIDVSIGKDIGLSAAIGFDPTGNILAVGSANGWQLWDVTNKRLLLEQKGGQVYSLAFSPDGRLFAWGDASGVVHIWGVSIQ